jgi:type 1 fimbria pilin
MKHVHLFSATAALLLASTAAASEGDADLLVRGSITPGGACTLVIANVLGLGTIHRGSLDPDPSKETQLEEQRVPVTVGCPQPTRFAFVVRGAGGKDASGDTFPLQMDESKKTAGKLFLLVDRHSTKFDGKDGFATGSDRVSGLEEATWGPSTVAREPLPIANGLFAVGFVDAPESTQAPANIKNLSTKLLVRPWIVPANDLDFSETAAFSSDLGLEINYF